MKTEEILKKASSKGMNAVKFDKWLEKNNINFEWLDVTLTDFNDGPYCIVIENPVGSAEFLDILFMDGKYQND